MAEKAVLARITGRVQGVWFRAWTREQAMGKGLKGWARNCADGSVEAMFVGHEDAVAAMLDLCRQGPPQARVENVDARNIDPAPLLKGFEIKRR